MDAPESKPERRRSFGSTFSFLQRWHERDCLGSRSSTSSTKIGASTRGSEGGEVVEPGSGSKSAPAARKQQQAQLHTSTMDHGTVLYFPSVRPEPHLASNNDSTIPADFGPRSPATLASAQLGHDKAQMKKVLRHAIAEPRKEVRNAGITSS